MLTETVFGPAGYPISGPSGPDAMAYLAKRGLFAMEYQTVRRVALGEELARKLGSAASENGINLSIHAPFAINLSSIDRKIVRESEKRLIKAAVVGQIMGASHVTFHPGFYGRRTKDETFKMQLEGLSRVASELTSCRVGIELGPETTGKESQFGSLDELLELSTKLRNLRPTIDFAHIHARSPDSNLRSPSDFLEILMRVERILGGARMDSLVLHFSEVETLAKGFGERRHRTIGSGFGPRFEGLADAMAELGYKMIVICESPLLDQDALRMKRIFEKRLSRRHTDAG